MIRADTIPASMLARDRISVYLSNALRPMPLLASLTAAGLAVVYTMGLLGVVERLGAQLLIAALLLLGLGQAHRAILVMAERGEAMRAFTMHSIATVAAGLGLALIWAGIVPVALLLIWTAPAITIPIKIQRRQFIAAIALSSVASIFAIVAANRPIMIRFASNTTAGFAALLLVTGMVILFIMLVLTSQAVRYRTLESRLAGTLVPIMAAPILFTTAIAAFNALTTSQQQFQNSLQAVSSLKQSQLNEIIQEMTIDLSSIQQGTSAPNVMHVLQRPGANDTEYRLNASLAATQIRDFMVKHPATDYEELLVLDKLGSATLATYLPDIGLSFADQDFFKAGLAGPVARFMRFPGQQNTAGEYKLVVAVPFQGETPEQPLGVVVAVAAPSAVVGILQPTTGLEDVQTYLVDSGQNAIASASPTPPRVDAAGIISVITARAQSGSGTYINYAGVPVVGYFQWDPTIQAAVVSEVPQSTVFARSLSAVLASGLVGLMTIIIAAVAVLAASRSLSEPVGGLAHAAQQLASGELGTRAATDREDEIGRLAGSFNSMANQLQATIASLEQRVAERTRALEVQTLRLRTSAEIARDAALAPTLEELLSRASKLVRERFDVEHVGIYLLDEKRQFAVLQASPSDEGQQMLAAEYRVLVGDRGPIGQAASSGEAQLVLQTGEPDVIIGDSYHHETQSQLTLPLRTNEGTIGLLDLQSTRPEVFSQADTATMQVLADQLAAAIERGRLLVQVQERLGLLEQTYRRFTEESWGTYSRNKPRALGYRFDNVRLEPLSEVPKEATQALSAGTTYVAGAGDGAEDGAHTAYVPIRLRGQTLGVVTASFREGPPPAKTLATLEQAVDRLGTALENVRLLEDSLRRASKERLIGEITARISSSISVRNVLQTAVEELGRVLPGTDVSINFRAQAAAGKEPAS